MTGQQRLILTAIIAAPHATIQEVCRSISHGSNGFLTQKQIKLAMNRFGITRERYKGAGYMFNVPDDVREDVSKPIEPVKCNGIDKVWTKPMNVAPHMAMYHFHADRMSIR